MHKGRNVEIVLCDCEEGWVINHDRFKTPTPPPVPLLDARFQRSCFRKSRFPTEEAAKKWLAKKPDSSGNVYGCTACGGYHFTRSKVPRVL